jgi:hypothetical protein
MAIANITGNILTDSGVSTSSLVSGSGTTNYLPKFTGASTLGDSIIRDSGTIGINMAPDTNVFSVTGTANNWATSTWASTTTGQSFGAIIRGGTNSSDVALRVNNAANSSTFFTINGNGNVGIGTTDIVSTNLTGALTIRKSYNGDTPNGATTQAYYANQSALYLFGRNSGLTIISNNTEEGSIIFGNNSTNAYASIKTGSGSSATGGDMYFQVGSNTERMRITSGGEVLIGTTSAPSAYGLVAIRGTNKGLTIQDAVSNGYRSLYFQSGNLYFYNGTNEGYLSSGGTWVNASDVTLKKDVKEIEYGLKEVMELKPKWYRMIEDDLEQIGFIAQDVEEVLPELVSTSEKGMKGLSYGQLTAVLVKAIQELSAKVSALENKS